MTRIDDLNEELEEIEQFLLIACQNNQLMLIDIEYIAQRVRDIKQAIRIELVKQ